LGWGRYVPSPGQSLIPQSLKNYRIKVITSSSEILESETTMPGLIDSAGVVLIDLETMQFEPVQNGDTLTRADPNLYFIWRTVEGAGGYKGFAKCLEPRDSTIVPLDPDWDPDDPDDKIEDKDIERAGWTPMRHDQTMTTLPWIIFNWQGRYQVSMLAVSTEYYEYLFSLQRVMQGMINKPKYNVTGDGFGVFGAYSRWDINIYMEKVESTD